MSIHVEGMCLEAGGGGCKAERAWTEHRYRVEDVVAVGRLGIEAVQLQSAPTALDTLGNVTQAHAATDTIQRLRTWPCTERDYKGRPTSSAPDHCFPVISWVPCVELTHGTDAVFHGDQKGWGPGKICDIVLCTCLLDRVTRVYPG